MKKSSNEADIESYINQLLCGDCLEMMNDRRYIGIEKEDKYFEIAKNRVEEYKG